MSGRRPVPVVLAWSGGKDSVAVWRWLTASGAARIVGAFTTVDAADGSVPHHGVSAERLAEQRARLPFPHRCLPLPVPTPNAEYEAVLTAELPGWCADLGASTLAFGDVHLEEVRAYREALVAGLGLTAWFPLWGANPARLARELIAGTDRFHVCAVDPGRVSEASRGARYDHAFLDGLPSDVDPLGERGEFHTVWEPEPTARATPPSSA